jgi:hypothetical protein
VLRIPFLPHLPPVIPHFPRLNRFQRFRRRLQLIELIAQKRGTFEFEFAGGFNHFLFDFTNRLVAIPRVIASALRQPLLAFGPRSPTYSEVCSSAAGGENSLAVNWAISASLTVQLLTKKPF